MPCVNVFPSFWYTTCLYKKCFWISIIFHIGCMAAILICNLTHKYFYKLNSFKFKSLPLGTALPLLIYTTCPYIKNIIYNYAISIIFQIYCMAAIFILFALPTYSYPNCTYVCCNVFAFLFTSFWYTTCPYYKYNIYIYSIFIIFSDLLHGGHFYFLTPTIIYLLKLYLFMLQWLPLGISFILIYYMLI